MKLRDYLKEKQLTPGEMKEAKAGLSRLLKGAYGYDWKGVKWSVLDYSGNKVQLGAYKEMGRIGKFFAPPGVDDKFVTKWVSLDVIQKGLESGEIKEIPVPKVSHVAR